MYRPVKHSDGYIRADPSPSPEELERFYHDQYYQDPTAHSSTYSTEYSTEELKHKRLLAKQHLYSISLARGSGVGPGRLLDVGCGEGFTLATAASEGWSVTGIDFSSYAIDAFHPDLSGTVHTGDAYRILDEFCDTSEHFDVCILTNVLEHVLDPSKLLYSLKSLLRPNGLIVATLPNDYSELQLKALELGQIDKEFWFSPPHHLNYFTTESGLSFAELHGFTARDVYAGFPVEIFLFHPGSNYIRNPDAGKPVHEARVLIDLLLAGSEMRHLDRFHAFCQATASCGLGRTFTMTLQSTEAS